jgi:hypothetical protein
MGISLVIACSELYSHNLSSFMQSISDLHRKPDEIVLVTDSVKPEFDCTIVADAGEWVLGNWYNLGFEAATQEWIVWTGVDDRLRPHALDSIDNSLADVIPFGLHYSTGQIWIPSNVSAESILRISDNLVPCGSPVRKRFWELQPFVPELYPFDDWAFWVGCAHNGAKFMPTFTIDVDYDYGIGHINPPMEPHRTNIIEWAKGLK